MTPRDPTFHAVYAAGFRAGASAMRDAAAKEAEQYYDSTLADPKIYNAIRALPLPEPPK